MEIYTGVFIGIFASIMTFSGFFLGFKTGKSICEKGDIEIIKPNFKVAKETDEQRKMRILAENIENYGTDIPQKEVM